MTVFAQAWQSWKSAKAVAALSAIALAVGIGSTTAIYTVVNAVMLKPLPYEHGERFVALFGGTVNEPASRSSLALPDLLEYQRQTQSFDVFGWFRMGGFNLTSPGQPQHINGTGVTPGLARGLGVNPIVGQWFTDDTGAVVSHSLWTRLGSDRGIVGKAITLNGRSYTITGVMPRGFRLPLTGVSWEELGTEVWIGLDPSGRGADWTQGFYISYARMKPGVTFAQAEEDVRRVAAEIARQNPTTHPSYTARLVSLRDTIVSGIRPTLVLLFAAAGLLLLITCANVAGLLLARSVARARETAIRVALGATQHQLALQFFLEGLFVALAGAAVGVLLSIAIVRGVLRMATAFIPLKDEITVDWRVLLFAAGMGCLAAALSSLAPLWQAARTLPNDVLNEGVRASAGTRTRGVSRSLVIAEIALAFALLAVSAVLIIQLRNLGRVRVGFDENQLITFQLTLPDTITAKREVMIPHQVRLTRAVEAIPGVNGAAFVNQLPLEGCCLSTVIYPEGRPPDLNVAIKTSYVAVSPGYFHTLRLPLQSGRLLTYHDSDSNPLLVIINQAAARYFWRGKNALGAYGRFLRPDGTRFQVVGIVGDVRNDGLTKPPVPEVYLLNTVGPVNPMYFVVRSPLPASTLIAEVRRVLHGIDPTQPIHHVSTMQDIIATSLTIERLGSFMMTFFAGAALLMAMLGVYGLVSYSVRQRAVEIGTRMALGANNRALALLVLGGGLKMAAYGVVIGGLLLATSLWFIVRTFEIRELGVLPFALSGVIVGGVAVAASVFPAWRATLLSPMVAIRNEPGSMWRAVKGWTKSMTLVDDVKPAVDISLLTEFVEASRRSDSFVEALKISLAMLRSRINAGAAILLEKVSESEYRSTNITIPADGFLANRLRFHDFPLPLSGEDFDTWRRWAAEQRPHYVSEIETLKNSGARIAVPLRTRHELLGILLLGAPVDRVEYSRQDRELLRYSAQQLALMMENAKLTQRVVEQEKIRRDLELAIEVQKRLLPEQPPTADMASLAAVSLPARSVGGDYYDFVDTGDHRIGIALADVAGKGVAAALIMSVVQASLRIIASEGDVTLPQLAAKMNRFLHRSTRSNSYATFFYAQLDQQNRQLHYVNAGHNPPYLVSSTLDIQELATGGTVIGLFPQMSYQQATIDLRSGDVLVAFTDGVTEALNPGEEEFGDDRLKDLLRATAHLPVEEISTRISQELRNWIKDAPQYDDLTFIVMKVN